MEDISLHILDMAENSINAFAKNIRIYIEEDEENDVLILEIEDDGIGMDKEALKKATDPFFTTKKGKKIGLGIPLLAQSANEAEGYLQIESKPGKGTKIRATFKYSHVDRKPLGNIEETLMTLITGHPEINFVFEHKKEKRIYRLDTKELKERNF